MRDASPLHDKKWDCSFQLSHLNDFISKSIRNNACSTQNAAGAAWLSNAPLLVSGQQGSIGVSEARSVKLCFPNLSSRGANGCHRVSGIHNTLSPLAQLPIINGGMIRRDEHEIEARNVGSAPLNGLLTRPARMLTSRFDHGDI